MSYVDRTGVGVPLFSVPKKNSNATWSSDVSNA